MPKVIVPSRKPLFATVKDKVVNRFPGGQSMPRQAIRSSASPLPKQSYTPKKSHKTLYLVLGVILLMVAAIIVVFLVADSYSSEVVQKSGILIPFFYRSRK